MQYYTKVGESYVFVLLPNGAVKKAACQRGCGSYACDETSKIDEPVTLLCFACASCRNCGKPGALNKEGFCITCICIGCGSQNAMRPIRDLDIGPQCSTCYFKTHPGSACLVCKNFFPEIYRKGDKIGSPSLCKNCVKTGSGFGPCCYCFGAATTIGKIVIKGDILSRVLCPEHSESFACGRNGCSPVKQCEFCKHEQKKRKNPYGHMGKVENCPCDHCRNFRNREEFYFENLDTTFYPAITAQDKRDGPARLSAAEIEVAGFKAPNLDLRTISDVARKWKISGIVQDASLKQGGVELCMAPAQGRLFIAEVTDLCAILRKSGAYVDKRCGTHIHVDTRDHNYEDLKKLVLLYAKIEPAIIRSQPFTRIMADKSHCYPCGEKYVKDLAQGMFPKETKKKLIENIYDGKFGDKPPRGKRGNNREIAARYNGFNIHSHFVRGTVEFRHHTGTIRPDKIIKWANICAGVVESAYRMSEHEIRTMKGLPDEILAALIAPEEFLYLKNRIEMFGKPYGPMKPIFV